MTEERVEMRLAAILPVDVDGYSRITGANEAGTLARLNALRDDLFDPNVDEYRGRVVNTTGDGALTEFPSAVDAAQHVVDASRCWLLTVQFGYRTFRLACAPPPVERAQRLAQPPRGPVRAAPP